MNQLKIFSVFLLIQLTSCERKKIDFHPELFNDESIARLIKLEKAHPTEFFGAAAENYRNNKINEAALFYYIGQLRYRYYIACHPNYRPDGDRAIFASLQSVIGSEINYKLGEDIDNYIRIIDAVIEWGEVYDSEFYSKENNPKKYDEIIMGLKNLKQKTIDNKDHIVQKRKTLK